MEKIAQQLGYALTARLQATYLLDKGHQQLAVATSTDTLLYALGVGAGSEDPSSKLAFTT